MNAARNFAGADDLPPIDEIEVVITSPGLPVRHRPPKQEIYNVFFKPTVAQDPAD